MNYTLITGATSDIGKQIAVNLSSNNRLILFGRNLRDLKKLRNDCENSSSHFLFIFDFNDISNLRNEFVEFLTKNSLFVDKIVHCAGMMKVMHMKSVDLKSTNQIFNVNLFSIIEIIAILLNKRINSGQLNNIVFISAILAKYGSTGHHLYSSSKAALDGLMRSLAVELAPSIRVNSILPGAVLTKMSSELLLNKAISDKLNHDYLLGIGSPKDIAPMVIFLLSDEASWITGQEFIIDGGRTINIKNN
ncbi:MAG: SDR family oxidoreductase [Flavobacteriaceae bacterium]|nr:SDR family oxidoreductase [Flavobacteriaceae bacterium]